MRKRISIALMALVVLLAGAGAALGGGFEKGIRLKAGGQTLDIQTGHLVPCVVDWNQDGKKDLITGQFSGGKIGLFLNEGTDAAPVLGKVNYLKAGGEEIRPSPFVVDWDGDGVKDLVTGNESAKVIFYRNVGTAQEPELEKGKELTLKGDGFEKGYRCRIDVTDWNNDGKLDILVGNFFSGQVDGKSQMGGNIWLFLGK